MKALQLILEVFSILLFASDTEGTVIRKPKNFGPYKVVWHKVETCKDFRMKPTYSLTTKLVPENGDILLHANYTAKEVIHVDKLRIRMLNNEKERRVLWSYSLEKPCKHISLGPYLVKILRSEECTIPKENRYVVVNLDISHVIGDNFFFGKYLLRASLHEKKKNIVCLNMSFSVVKKTSCL